MNSGASVRNPADHRAPVRSFVLRQGRMTPAQERAFEQHWNRYGIEYGGGERERDFAATFGRDAPRVLEIGFGNGEVLHASAREDPARDYIGVEVHGPGVGRLLNAVAMDGLDNVRVYRHDAVEVLRHEIAPESLTEIRVWFPDPWPKVRHHKRRLIQPEFVRLACDRLCRGGVLHLATDWAEYAEQMAVVLAAEPELSVAALDGDATVTGVRASTHFERRGVRLGHGVRDFIATRTGAPHA